MNVYYGNGGEYKSARRHAKWLIRLEKKWLRKATIVSKACDKVWREGL